MKTESHIAAISKAEAFFKKVSNLFIVGANRDR